ncbi:MAG: threonine-phosphate decarboxylase CobD [Alphaproteobacteria bacterium]|jgi:cobalamin biosynthetic protein CobC|nr:threonine-phosphate decarboxylase CobD [Alphaproteobacteria bacterium]
MTDNPCHGGDLASAEARFGRPAGQWLDLSTGINPNPYPITDFAPEALARLPQEPAETGLLGAASAYFQLASNAAITAAPGTQAIIQWLPTLRTKARVGILGPTYAEHEFCWRAAGHSVDTLSALPEPSDLDVCIAVNPNSPDGRRHDPAALLSLAQGLSANGGWLIVDEAFVDPHPELSLAGAAGQKGLIVLRSFGKFFGLAGLRLGFALGDAGIVEPLRRAIGPWAISGPAMEIGARAIMDAAWIDATRKNLRSAAARLNGLLAQHGLNVVGGTDLFRLVEHSNSKDLFRKLAEQGILTRSFDYREDWLRFGLPGNDADFERLHAAL